MNSAHGHEAECPQCEWAVTGDFNPLQTLCWVLSAVHRFPIHHRLHPHGKGESQSIPSIGWIPPNGLQQTTAVVIRVDRLCPVITSMICTYRGEINSRRNDLHGVVMDTTRRLDSAWPVCWLLIWIMSHYKYAKLISYRAELIKEVLQTPQLTCTSDFNYFGCLLVWSLHAGWQLCLVSSLAAIWSEVLKSMKTAVGGGFNPDVCLTQSILMLWWLILKRKIIF